MKIDLNIFNDPDFHVNFPLIGLLNHKSVLIIFSNSLKNSEILFAIQEAKQRNVFVIVVTSSEITQFSNYINLQIVYSKIHDLNKNIPTGSKLSQFLIIDYLFDYILQNGGKKLKINMEKTNEVISKWHKYKYNAKA